jgi:hypothetical protein
MGFDDFVRHYPGPKAAGDPHGVKLREAIREAGDGECPLCHVLLDRERARLYWLAYEGLADAALRRRIAAARGFCPRHLRAVYTVISDETRNVSAIAQVMRDLIALDRAAIAGLDAARTRPKAVAARLLSALHASAGCPLCEEAAEVEARKVSTFVAALSDEGTRHAYESGRSGLCRRHLLAALATTPDTAALRVIVDKFESGLKRDDADLAELLRKTDHRLAGEPKGGEQHAPARSVRRHAGTWPP